MTHFICYISLVISVLSLSFGVVQSKEQFPFNGQVKIFTEHDFPPDFIDAIRQYFSKLDVEIEQLNDALDCSAINEVDTVDDSGVNNQIYMLFSRRKRKWCTGTTPNIRTALVKFNMNEVNVMEVEVWMDNEQISTIVLDTKNGPSELNHMLDEICAKMPVKSRQKRYSDYGVGRDDFGAPKPKKEKVKASPSGWKKKTVPTWAAFVILLILCFGYICTAILFFVDHSKNFKRLVLLKSKLAILRDSCDSPQFGRKKSNKKKGKKSKDSKKDAREDEFFKKVTDVALFCAKLDDRQPNKNDTKSDGVKCKPLNKCGSPNDLPVPLGELLSELQSQVIPLFDEVPSIRAHGYYPGMQSKTDIIVSLLCDTVAIDCNATDTSPAMKDLEEIVTNWMGKAMGLPKAFLYDKGSEGGGVIQGTTTQGIFTALVAACRWKAKANKGDDGKVVETENDTANKFVAYGCQEAHLSFDIGCRLAKVECQLVGSNADGTLNVVELQKEIEDDVAVGKNPALVIVTLGSSQTCAFDNLKKIVDIAKRYNMWVHVDASYAGNYLICEKYRQRMAGIENAHSICINLHKCLTQCATETLFWSVDNSVIKESAVQVNHMLKTLHADGACHEYATASTNRYKALKLYVWLRLSGLDGIKEYIRSVSSMTARFRQHMSTDGRLVDRTFSAEYGFIAFSWQRSDESDNTYRLCAFIMRSNKMNVSMVSLGGIPMIRITFNREHIAQHEVDESWNVLRQLLDEWQAEEKKGNAPSKADCARYIHESNGNIMGPPSVGLDSVKGRIATAMQNITPENKEKPEANKESQQKGPIMSPASSSKKNSQQAEKGKASKDVLKTADQDCSTAKPFDIKKGKKDGDDPAKGPEGKDAKSGSGKVEKGSNPSGNDSDEDSGDSSSRKKKAKQGETGSKEDLKSVKASEESSKKVGSGSKKVNSSKRGSKKETSSKSKKGSQKDLVNKSGKQAKGAETAASKGIIMMEMGTETHGTGFEKKEKEPAGRGTDQPNQKEKSEDSKDAVKRRSRIEEKYMSTQTAPENPSKQDPAGSSTESGESEDSSSYSTSTKDSKDKAGGKA